MAAYGSEDRWGRRRSTRAGFCADGAPEAGARDSYVFTAPGMNHGANVAGLVPREKALATARILDWAGVASPTVQSNPSAAKPLAAYDAKLDRRDVEREPALRP
nr:hypothetical protein [Streptomyces colonosanans]